MLLNAYAKINLILDIIGKRFDNYHEMEMLNCSIGIYDEVSIEKIEDGIELFCTNKELSSKSNIAYKAARLMIDTFKINGGVKISIKKNIPVSAGLAGGSTDAAAVIKGINEIYDLKLDMNMLMNIGAKLGADVPFCIHKDMALCKGIGEDITPLFGMDKMIILLVKPSFGVSTKEVFDEYDLISKDNIKKPDVISAASAIKNNDFKKLSQSMGNVLENVTIKLHGEIDNIKNEMINNGACISLMSGSGPSVFGIFNDKAKAEECYLILKNKYKDTYLTKTL